MLIKNRLGSRMTAPVDSKSRIQDNVFTLAVVSIYSEADPVLLKESAGTSSSISHQLFQLSGWFHMTSWVSMSKRIGAFLSKSRD